MLCDPAGRRVPAHDWLKQMADDRVQDDQPMQRDLEREPDHTGQPQWCPRGLTKSQKRRVQRLRQLETLQEFLACMTNRICHIKYEIGHKKYVMTKIPASRGRHKTTVT